jgi:parallel beta-helix repeat protein
MPMNTLRKQIVLILSASFFSSAGMATVITVDDDGPADYDNIQSAIDAASNGDEIVVSPGEYQAPDNTAVVNMKGKAVWLHSASSQYDTIIYGNFQRRGILCNSGETSTTVIEGFTIQNCVATWQDWDGDGIQDSWETAGGGMTNVHSSPSIIGCTFTANIGIESGGGMFNYESNPSVTNCVFQWNSALSGDGGGMSNRMSSPDLINCEFNQNDAELGGGMYNYDGSSPVLETCTFTSNSASYLGGGIYNRFFSEPTLDGCMFDGNTAVHGGGGMFSSSLSNTTIMGCDFINNSATAEGSIGGGIGNSNSSPTLTNCTLTDNTASGDGGGLYCTVGSQVILANCTINSNQANRGGGTYFDFFCDVTIDESTLQNNTGILQGGALHVNDYCDVAIIDTELSDNTSPGAGGVWSSNENTLVISGSMLEQSLDIAGFDGTEIRVVDQNTIGRIVLQDVSSELQIPAGASLTMLGGIGLQGSAIKFDVDTLNSSAPVACQDMQVDGAFGISNTSGTLANASVGDVIRLVQGHPQGHFESIVLPAMPQGLGLIVLIDSIGLQLTVIEDEGVQLDDPLLTGLDGTPVDLVVVDIEGDGKDELAVLYGGSPGTVAVYAVSGDASPVLIHSLTTSVGNNPVDMDGKDLNNDGKGDLVIANADDSSITVLTTFIQLQGTLNFNSKTVSVPGSNQKPSCVSIIDWNNNLSPIGDIVVGIDKIDENENDVLQVILDVTTEGVNGGTVGPAFIIPKYEYAGSEFPDAPTGVDGFKGGTARVIERGFIAGTRYGNIYKGTISGARGTMINIGQLNGRNITSIDVTDLDDGVGDGKQDVLVGSDEAGMIYIIPGDDSRANGFGDIISIEVSVPVNDIYATDVDGDGDKDFVVTAPEASSYFVLRNGGASTLLPGGMGNRAWNKQDIPSSNTPDKVTGGDLDDKNEDDDWMSNTGTGSGLFGPQGSMEQTNIIFGGADCPGDLNVDGSVGVNDLLILIAAWGPCDGCDADLNADGNVNVNDLLVLIAAWGPCGT